ncbi:MAG: TetR/AcrR family transcriptional regulator [Acidobacteriota bacterium]|nr:TetR/AcrR family transcriptional regulator [Acidobacteriota bacterium]
MHKNLQLAENANARRAPGRPRSERARLAILRSTREFLESPEHGFGDLSIEHIATRAGVGKATVYRWWPTKAALAADAFASSVNERLHFPDTGSVQLDMTQQMRRLVQVLRSRRGHVALAILGAGQSDRTLLAAFRDQFVLPRRVEAKITLQRAIDRGELPPHVDMEHLLDALYGPIYMRFLIRHAELTQEFVERHCTMVFEKHFPKTCLHLQKAARQAATKSSSATLCNTASKAPAKKSKNLRKA